MKVLLFVVLIVSSCLAELEVPAEDDRIVGGQDAKRGQFPHQVSIQNNKGHFCGGSIISRTIILTAAHCVYGNTEIMIVVVGITNLREQGIPIPVQKYVYHPRYDPKALVYDIAMLFLTQALPFGGNVRPIHLRNYAVNPNELLTASGWGYLSAGGSSPAQLQWIQLFALDLQTCAKELTGRSPITTGHVCTTSPVNRGTCMGDSGGPLIDAFGSQVGIVSWGVPCAKGKPDVFTSIAFFLPWINRQA